MTVKHNIGNRCFKKALLILVLLNLQFIYILTSLQGGAGGGSLWAQDITLQVTPTQQVLPPRPGEYIDNLGRYFRVTMINNTDAAQRIYFGVQVQQKFPSDVLWMSTNVQTMHIPQQPIVLSPNQHKTLNSIEMRHLFDHFDSHDIFVREGRYKNILDSDFGLMDEGQYELQLTAYKWDPELSSPVVLNNPTDGICLFNVCYEAEAPVFTTPDITFMDGGLGDLSIINIDKANPRFEWKTPTLNCNATMVQWQYDIRFVELGSMMPDEAMQTNTITFLEKKLLTQNYYTIPSAYITQMIADTAAQGKIYAMQVTAHTPYQSKNALNVPMIKNEGKSPIVLFRLQDQTKDISSIKGEAVDVENEKRGAAYIYEQPILTSPTFAGNWSRLIYQDDDIEVKWRQPALAGGWGEQQDTIKFNYTLALYTGNSADNKEVIFKSKALYDKEFNKDELKDDYEYTIKWDDIKEKVKQGDYLMLRITAKPTNKPDSIFEMKSDSLNYTDFALTTHFNENYQCGHDNITVKNQTKIGKMPEKGTSFKIGQFYMTFDENVKFEKEDSTFTGTGWVRWKPQSDNFYNMNARVAVKFSKLKVNTDNEIFEGKCQTYSINETLNRYNDTEALDSLFSITGLDNVFGALELPEDVRNAITKELGSDPEKLLKDEVGSLAKSYHLGKYYSELKQGMYKWDDLKHGDVFDLYFPVELPDTLKEFLPKDFSLQIGSMQFTPQSAQMNLIAEVALPNSDIFDGQDVLIFGAPRLCITPDKFFPEEGVLALLSNLPLKDPNSDFKMVFKAPTEPLDPMPKDGCFLRWAGGEFGGLGLNIACTVPNTKRIVDGKAQDDIPALIDLWTVIEANESAGDFIASGKVTPFEVTDLPGWSFHVADEIVFDHNMDKNSNIMPNWDEVEKKYTVSYYDKDDKTIKKTTTFDRSLCGTGVKSDWNAWQGLYIKNVEVEFPKFAVFGKGEEGVKVGAQNMLLDASGISCRMYAQNILDAQTGRCGGWMFGIDEATVDIIQNNFDNCKITGSIGVPLLGKKADRKANEESKSKGKGDTKKADDGQDTDFNYSCEIRHLTDPENIEYYTYDKSGTKKEKHTRKKYANTYGYVFSTVAIPDLSLNCFVADLTLKQCYFLVESIDEEKDENDYTQVELCLAGDINIAGADDINATISDRVKSLIKDLPIDLKLPGIHFTKMRLSNVAYDKWRKDLGLSTIHEEGEKAQEEIEKELKKKLFYTSLNRKNGGNGELELGKECFFRYGEWSLASMQKKIGPFTFNLETFEPNYDEKEKQVSLAIFGGLGLVENKICVDAGVTITAKANFSGDVSNWYLSDGEVTFDSLKVGCDFTALKLEGVLNVGKNAQGEKGYAGRLTIDVNEIFSLDVKGGYYEHEATENDKKEREQEAKDEAAKEGKEYTKNASIDDPKFSYGYFMVDFQSKVGIHIDPVVINGIRGGFFFNCRPTKGESNFDGTPVADYGTIGLAFGMGLSTSAGEETLKVDADLLVAFNRKRGELTTFMFNGKAEAVGGIIKADMSLVYEKTPTDRYLCLNITSEMGFGNNKLTDALNKMNEELQAGADALEKLKTNVANLTNEPIDKIPEKGLGMLSGKYDKDGQQKENKSDTELTKEEEAKLAAQKQKNTKEVKGITSKQKLEFKVTWMQNGVKKTPTKWHLYLGEPDKDKRCSFIFLDFDASAVHAHIGADAYLCIGNELPGNGQLPAIPSKITEFLNGHKKDQADLGADMAKVEQSRKDAAKAMLNPSGTKGGVMVGASAWGDMRIDLGLIYGSLDANAGFDAALVNYGKTAFCTNTHSAMGYGGWYAMGQLYAYLAADLGLRIHIGELINKDVNLLNAGIGGVLEMGLPNPTWLDGQARIKFECLSGLVKIDRSFSFSFGDHCTPFLGNALDGFELFQNVSMGSDSLYQALYKPEFAISKNDVSKMTFATNASLGSHYRLIDPNAADKMKKDFYGDDYYDKEMADSLNHLVELQASRTYVFDMNQDTRGGMKLGVRLIDLGTKPTQWLEQGRSLSAKDFKLELMKQGLNDQGEQVYAGFNSPKSKSDAVSALGTHNDVIQFIGSYFSTREQTVSEMSTAMMGADLSMPEREILHSGEMASYLGYLLDHGRFKDGTTIKMKERNVTFREEKGRIFHLSDMNVEAGHSYALLLMGDAYEIENGYRVWCDYVNTDTNTPERIKWQQAKLWFFRVKSNKEDKIIGDSLTSIESYVALAYPSVDGTKVSSIGTGYTTAYHNDIMHPTIALNRDLRFDVPQGKMKWVLTAYHANEYERDDSLCWRYRQERTAKYIYGDNCLNLEPNTPFKEPNVFANERSSKGSSYNYANQLYHLELLYTYKDTNLKDSVTNKFVDLWLTSAPYNVTVNGKTYTDSWMETTNREITGELLPYTQPFVGASPSTAPVFSYENSLKKKNDVDLAFNNVKLGSTPYRLVDPWLYLAYLSKFTFVGDRKIYPYTFDPMGVPHASESLVYEMGGTIINSDYVRGEDGKTLWELRNDMYNTWNDWSYNSTLQPEWPLPVTLKTVGGPTVVNQNNRASTVTPRNVKLQPDRTYSFVNVAQDFMRPYDVAKAMSSVLKKNAQKVWDAFADSFFPTTQTFRYSILDQFMKELNADYRGHYIKCNSGNVSAKVPFYQLPLIFGGCFGTPLDPVNDKPTYMGISVSPPLVSLGHRRGFDASLVEGYELTDGFKRFGSRRSNLLFFRLLGSYAPSWAVDVPARMFISSYLDANNSDEIGAWPDYDEFDRESSLKYVTSFKARIYRVDAYNMKNGFYQMKERGGGPWVDSLTIGSGNLKNMGDMVTYIRESQAQLENFEDTDNFYAIYTESDNTLTFAYTNEKLSSGMESSKLMGKKALTKVYKNDALNEYWKRDNAIRSKVKHVVIHQTMLDMNPTSMNEWFADMKNLVDIQGLGYLNTDDVVSMKRLFKGCTSLVELDLHNLRTPNVESMQEMFSGCTALKKISVIGFDTKNVKNFYRMFQNCSQLKTLNLTKFSGASATITDEMFSGCSSLSTLYIDCFDANEYVMSCSKMFVNVPNSLVSYINVCLKQEIKDQIPGRKNVDYSSMKAVLAEQSDGKNVLIFLNTGEDLKTGNTYLATKNASYGHLNIKKVYAGNDVMKTPTNSKPGWAGDKTLYKVIFDASFKASPTSMYGWFQGCENLNTISVKGKLLTKEVTTMAHLLDGCSNLKSAAFVTEFNTDQVKDMSYMFNGCKSLTMIQLNHWDWDKAYFNTKNVEDMSNMFAGCENAEKIELSDFFNMNSLTKTVSMFQNCKKLERIVVQHNYIPMDKADKLIFTNNMFNGCESLNSFADFIKLLNTSEVMRMDGMFRDCSSLTELDLSHFTTEDLKISDYMFLGCTSLKKVDLSHFEAASLSTAAWMFKDVPTDCYIYLPYNTHRNIHPLQVKVQTHPNLVLIYPSKALLLKSNSTDKELVFLSDEAAYSAGQKYDGKEIVDVWTDNALYNGGAPWRSSYAKDIIKVTFKPSFETVMVTNMNNWFYGMNRLTNIEGMEYLNTSQVKKMENLFNGCNSLKHIDLSHFDTGNVESMHFMFHDCLSLEELDLSHLNTSKVTDMYGMFSDCKRLKRLDLSNFNTANVNNMTMMFEGCKALKQLDVSSFDTRAVNSFTMMFSDCSSLTELDLSNFYITDKAAVLGYMLYGCTSLRTLYVGSAFQGKSEFSHADWEPVPDKPTNNTFGKVHDLYVYVKAGSYDRIRQYLLKLGFVEGETGEIYGPGREPIPQAVWTEGNSTLTFIFNPTLLKVGDTFNGQTVTAVWNGTDITDTPSNNQEAPWSRTVMDKMKHVVIESAFSRVTPKSTSYWFAELGTSTLQNIKGLAYLNTSEVTDMSGMFRGCHSLKRLNLSNFNTEKVTNMSDMFRRCGSLLAVDLSGFNTDNVTNMNGMFFGFGTEWPLDISNFNTGKVNNADYLFANSKVKYLTVGAGFGGYFGRYGQYNYQSHAFDNVKGMQVTINTESQVQAHQTKTAFKEYLNFIEGTNGTFIIPADMKVQKIWIKDTKTLIYYYGEPYGTNASNGRYNGYSITSIWNLVDGKWVAQNGFTPTGFSGDPKNLATTVVVDRSFSQVRLRDASNMFALGPQLTTILGLKYLNTSEVENMDNMFLNCGVEQLDVSQFDTRSVKSMANMFMACFKLKTLDLSGFDTHLVEQMQSMFNGCTALTDVKLDHFDVSMVKRLDNMFYGCSSLKALNLRSFSLNNGPLEKINSMFAGCTSLRSLKLSHTFQLPNINYKYYYANAFDRVTKLKVIIYTPYSLNRTLDLERDLEKMGFKKNTGTIERKSVNDD